MKNSIYRLIVVLIVATMFGCVKKDDAEPSPTASGTQSIASFQPKGTISGLIINGVTKAPVANALISVGFDGGNRTTTSSATGVFSFADVPAGRYQMVNGTNVATGTYTLSASLVDVNAAQNDANLKYRDYYYSLVTITFTSLSLGDTIPVGGMVGAVVINVSHLNTTLKGTVVDQNYQPVQNADVTLYDATVFPNIALGQMKSGSAGEYQFSRIDNGLTVTIKARSADGSLQGALAGNWTLPANVSNDSLRTQVVAERIRLLAVDNVAPFVTKINPEHNADISSGSPITVTFSESIQQNAYTRTDLPLGTNTIMDGIIVSYLGFKKSSANMIFSAQWQNNNTQLVITPQGMTGYSKYSFDIRPALNSGNLKDMANNAVVNNATITGDFELLNFTTNAGSAVPAAPNVTRRYIAGFFPNIDYTGGTIGMQWNEDPNARSYNIYRSINSGPFDLLQKDYFSTQFSSNTGSLVVPANANDPMVASNVRYQVRAVSKDLVESNPSNIITVVDEVKPKLLSAAVAPGGGTNNWVYTLRFSEPMKVNQAEIITNYTFSNTSNVQFAVTKADYIGFSVNAYVVILNVSTAPAPVAGYILVVNNSMVDLQGLSIDPQANSRTF